MSRTLTLEIPDELYAPLLRRARAEGRSVEGLAADCLAASVASADKSDNPLYNIIGIAKGGRVDGAENHDRYLYREDAL